MALHSNLLVLVNLGPRSDVLIERAKQITAGATITLLHVIEAVPVDPLGETVLPTMQVETELVARAQAKLRAMAEAHGLPDCAQEIAVGSIKKEAWRVAQARRCDLIVVGNHNRKGLKALLNFTEDAILHVAPCDVLAVHLAKAG